MQVNLFSPKLLNLRTFTVSISDIPAFLLYIVGHEIRKLTLRDGVETTLVYWRGLGNSPPISVDFHYKENRLYWTDGYSIYRSFLNGSGGLNCL